MKSPSAQIVFEEEQAQLTAVEIGRKARHPLIAQLHGALFALGVVVSTYHVQTRSGQLVERIVFQRADGQALDAQLSEQTKAALLPLVLGDETLEHNS